MPKFIDTDNNFEMDGEFDFDNHGPDASENTLILPAVTALPAIVYNDGQICYVSTSGILAMTVGGVWKTIQGN
jgi:hypothetical protein